MLGVNVLQKIEHEGVEGDLTMQIDLSLGPWSLRGLVFV